MARLTERFPNGQAAVAGCGGNCVHGYKYCDGNGNCPTLDAIYEKLARYEDFEEKGAVSNIAELQKAIEEIHVLKEKCHYWEMRCDDLDRERHFLQAQMDVVRLIFGGKNYG